MEPGLRELVEEADLNRLLRAIDNLCGAREWDRLVELADACEEAVERGKQLWPISSHIDYRLALEAPGEYAADVLTTDAARFSHGPLTEVAASTHTWDELVPHIELPQVAAYVAQERVLRGEKLTGDERAHPEVLEMPLELAPWEPTYALASFKPTYVEVAEPWAPRSPLAEVAVEPGDEVAEPAVREALLELVAPWTSESNGAARAVVVAGDARRAASALTFERLRLGPLDGDEAVQWMAWAAASGGAHGRRRGAAFGRFLAWYTIAVAAGVEWPSTPGAMEQAGDELRWFRWDEGSDEEEGWVLRIAVENEKAGWSAALGATDVDE